MYTSIKLYLIFVLDKQLSISLKTKKMKAIIYFKNGSKSLVIVNSSYSRGGVHHYNLTLNALNTFLDFKAGITKLFTGEEITSLTYTMS